MLTKINADFGESIEVSLTAFVMHKSACWWSCNFLLKNQMHFRTKRNLHSHAEIAPLTTHHNQVTGYGDVST